MGRKGGKGALKIPEILKAHADNAEPLEALELIKNAILNKEVNVSQVKDVLRQVLHQYELKSRIFLVASAQAEVPRIVRLLTFINDCEEELFKPTRVSSSSTKELTRLYALAQSNLLTGLDNVKRVADMRLEMLQAGGKDPALQMLDSDDGELSELAGLPGLDAPGRDRVRKLVTGLMDAIESDSSVTYDEDDDDEPDFDDSED